MISQPNALLRGSARYVCTAARLQFGIDVINKIYFIHDTDNLHRGFISNINLNNFINYHQNQTLSTVVLRTFF
jgi:hypothetical protein